MCSFRWSNLRTWSLKTRHENRTFGPAVIQWHPDQFLFHHLRTGSFEHQTRYSGDLNNEHVNKRGDLNNELMNNRLLEVQRGTYPLGF